MNSLQIQAWLKNHLPTNILRPLQVINRRRIGLVLSCSDWFGSKWRDDLIGRIIYRFASLFSAKKVSFIIVGAQKSGTTALWSFLGKHPDIELSLKKETNFFSDERNWKNGADYGAYRRQFKLLTGSKILGEASPSYMPRHEKVASRIFGYNPEIKLIFILKNPSERAYSQYKMHLKSQKDMNYPFEQCLEIAKYPDSTNEMHGIDRELLTDFKNYLDYGRYSKQIKTFLSLFERKQMLFLRTEELELEHANTLNKVFAFLGVNPVTVEQRIVHSNAMSPMSDEARELLRNEYSESIVELESLLGWDLSTWK